MPNIRVAESTNVMHQRLQRAAWVRRVRSWRSCSKGRRSDETLTIFWEGSLYLERKSLRSPGEYFCPWNSARAWEAVVLPEATSDTS
eukprot:CAMPEP_0175927054 /NCGR_PEP_ID=MMETSP0108-20121206/16517_1 /TAXON_ID=195067 ORGANISM="Goniomonas pacifica, Strain CCMP1869" /NCGR_SAMPLE_ID=MMETSP0108 /ASSEMBLY_ACC=CAM_ASM_000204 /LENGTH=86 /DNA_ID=CAMNT_0017250331 /DNA_START=346 /DNA_END=606 /DNA_ORIENTATION=-